MTDSCSGPPGDADGVSIGVDRGVEVRRAERFIGFGREHLGARGLSCDLVQAPARIRYGHDFVHLSRAGADGVLSTPLDTKQDTSPTGPLEPGNPDPAPMVTAEPRR